MHNGETRSTSTERTVIEAIVRRRVVTAVYNGTPLALSPHSMFARHGALFVSALNSSKARRVGEDPRLGVFKLAGLSEVVVTDEPFDLAGTDSEEVMRPDDELVFAL
ncbi:hypothetical protein ACWPM1_12850 [Tsuneonella sp. HG249]